MGKMGPARGRAKDKKGENAAKLRGMELWLATFYSPRGGKEE